MADDEDIAYDFGHLTGSVKVLWQPRDAPRRGPKPALSLERIVATAIVIADTDGLAALSMQRVAEDLGFTKMSLYRYLPGKAELVALMTDAALGAPGSTPTPGAWRTGLTHWAEALLRRFRRHPWLLEATMGSRAMGPHELTWMDHGLTTLAGTGLNARERLDAVFVVNGHVRAVAQQAVSGPPGGESALERMLTELLAAHADRYPELAIAVGDDATGARDDAFAFGLDRILDGLGALITERASST